MRVPRTFVFVDISGFTNFTASNSDEALNTLLKRWRSITRDLASECGVRIAKWLGDGCMIVAVGHRAAIDFAMRLQDRADEACAPLTMRIGVVSGEALLFEGDDYIGEAVNLAARLCDAAEPGQVLTPADQVDDLPAGVGSVPMRALTLRGLDAPVEVVSLVGTPASPGTDTGELWTREQFVV
jgi:class 3 adenylate cyclase